MKKENNNWFDDHVEIIGLDPKSKKVFKDNLLKHLEEDLKEELK